MEVPHLATTSSPDNLTPSLFAIIDQMTKCMLCCHEHATSKDAELQQLHKDIQQHKAQIKARDQTIHAQAEYICRLELEMSPMELSCSALSPAAFSMSLQASKMSDSITDPQSPSVAGERLEHSLQKTCGQLSDDDDAGIPDDAFAPLMALAMTAVEDITGKTPGTGDMTQAEIQSPGKRGTEEGDIQSKRRRCM
uniref:Uncharacterized protein n=1 Tax=Colletotrichum fructicola (strain Nara gc5) TaxID=1213859 RepID=L2GFR5_COLFN